MDSIRTDCILWHSEPFMLYSMDSIRTEPMLWHSEPFMQYYMGSISFVFSVSDPPISVSLGHHGSENWAKVREWQLALTIPIKSIGVGTVVSSSQLLNNNQLGDLTTDFLIASPAIPSPKLHKNRSLLILIWKIMPKMWRNLTKFGKTCSTSSCWRRPWVGQQITRHRLQRLLHRNRTMA